jgi:hypothetical protein
MKFISILSLGLSFSLLFTRCQKCVQNEIGYLKFTQDELRINPYTAEEVLIFIDQNGDSVIFPAGVRKTEVREVHKYDYETAKLDHHGCQGDYFFADNNFMEKNDPKFPSSLSITLNFRYTIDKPNSDKAFTMFFFIETPKVYGFMGDYNFMLDTLLNYKTRYTTQFYKDSVAAFHSILTLGPKTFFKVYELYCHNPDYRDTAWISTAYYSIKDGLVGFKTSFGETWHLDKIK